MPFVVGENVGPYRIIEKLGQGGMATVYKAYHAALDRYVAIKVLHPAFMQDPNFLARFQREARVVAKLEHPNIVPIHDFAEHEGQPYLVMRFIPGETLKARLGRGRLDQAEMLKIVDAIGSALGYAHQQGILHRDVKPSNILLAEDGNIYLADFGLARIAQAGESTLSSDMLLGTPQYISPEQALGKSDLDEGTDIYSFGVVLYELVVGKVPYSADTPYSIIHDHIYTPLPLPSKVNMDIPEAMERVLLKALAKDRADRFADVPALAAAFKQALLGGDATVESPAGGIPAPEAVAPSVPVETVIHADLQEQPAEIKTPVLSAAEMPAGAEEAISQPEVAKDETSKKRKWRWWYLAPILAACFCGLLILGSISDKSKAQQAQNQTAVVQTSPTDVIDQPQSQPQQNAIDEALQAVDQNPDDPYAYLRLALAYLDQDQVDPALGAAQQGYQLAGDNLDFFVTAGNEFKTRERWALASLSYLRASEISMPDIPSDLTELTHQSMYYASRLNSFPKDIPFDWAASIDLSMSALAKARHVFYHDDQAQAHELLDIVDQREPGMPEVQLLRGEFMLSENPKEGRAMLNDLINNPEVPQWIKKAARININQSNK